MSLSFLDGSTIKDIRKNILKLNLGVTFDASQIGYGQSVFTDRNKFTTVNQLDPNVVDEPRALDDQIPFSLNLLRSNKYQSSVDGYRLVDLNSNPIVPLGNESKTEYTELVEPYVGPTNLFDVKSLILNSKIGTYRDTPIGLIGITALDGLIKENIASNIESSTVGRYNKDPLSLLKGNSLIIPDRKISKLDPSISNIFKPTNFLQAGTELVNEYLGYTAPVSTIPRSAIGWNEWVAKKRSVKERGNSKFANFLEGVEKTANKVKDSLNKLGGATIVNLSTEARMEELLKYTGQGQKEIIFQNLSQNLYQPGYSYRQSLLKNKTLSNYQNNSIKSNLINRGKNGDSPVYGLLANEGRYNKFGINALNPITDNDTKSVLKSNGMVRIAPNKDKQSLKNYMFSIENLAWADVPDAFMSEGEKGNGDPSSGLRGKMMWFPPYELSISEDSSASWDPQDFIGRPEPVYTYNSTTRGGSLSFKILVDHPSIINLVRGTQDDVLEKYFSGEIDYTSFDPSKIVGLTEDQKRTGLKGIFGGLKKPKLNVDTPSTGLGIGVDFQINQVAKLINTLDSLNKNKNKVKTETKPTTFWSDVENNWFNELSPDQSITFKYLSEKIQYFHPAFHSTSPEGFNSRLTFLQQCVRQGPSITENSSNSGNLAFGRPPVCILRIGDFYNTKIIIDTLGIKYDNDTWDLNPDGIGVQPMIATITLGIKFIGGSSLTGPINKLQNAVSFNFFANTEVYESRSNFWADRPPTSDKTKGSGKILKDSLSGTKINDAEIPKAKLGDSLKGVTSGIQTASSNATAVATSGGQLIPNYKDEINVTL
jgi:hypothetical protein